MESNLKIDLLDKEYWWGGTVYDGIYMPFNDSKFTRNLYNEQLYNQSCPLLLSSKGRYIWCEDPLEFSFDDGTLVVKTEKNNLIFSEGHKNLRGAFMDASKNYFAADGGYPDPLMFSAPQYNTWIEMMYEPTQEKVLQYAESILNNGMPAGVMIIDDNWQEDYGVWSFNAIRFPQPKVMIDKLHEMGFKVMLWVCNFISPDSLTSRNLGKNDYLVKDKDGRAAVTEWWNGYSTMIDLTNNEAEKWFTGQLDRLVSEYGVDGFKFDAGDLEYFKDNFVCSSPINGLQYSEEWAKLGLNYKLNEYRACWKMGGKPLGQRLSDKIHSWKKENGLGSLIPNGLAQGIMGHAFSCPDMIGGGEYLNFIENSKNIDMELIVRNCQCSALFPMMQFSVAPWRVLDEDHLKICVKMANLHKKLGEYILQLAEEASTTGEPIIRHMDYVFPGNGYEKINDQFMLGDDVLVAPVLEKGAVTKRIVFPEGVWIGDDNSVINGPCIKTVDAPLQKLPWYRQLKTNKVETVYNEAESLDNEAEDLDNKAEGCDNDEDC